MFRSGRGSGLTPFPPQTVKPAATKVEKNELLPLYSFLGELINPTAAVTAKRGGPVRPDRLGTTV